MIPEGTRYYLPPEARLRRELAERLTALFHGWGYELVELPALELYDPRHVLAERSFKLVDKTGDVLALRSDFTSALANLVEAFPPEHLPVRYQYAGQVWLREADAELGRVREYTQFGVELVGVSSPQADAEVLELAWEALRALGFVGAKIEVGLPSLVRDLLESVGLEPSKTEALRQVIHRKNIPELASLLEAYRVGHLAPSILALPDLYGGREVLREAHRLSLSEKAKADLDWLEEVLTLLPQVPLLLDLGRARRLDYYTGINFQAYTQDFGLPLLGGGRYDGTLLPQACGFTVGLERVMEALRLPSEAGVPQVLAVDRALARQLRAQGQRVELAWTDDLAALRRYARSRGIPLIAVEGRLEEIP
ncbi:MULTISPECIES: ATP phosphoribosyltransferase regulatory subunit [unclassified Meiothermus]|uniref:ATP phosphoribosyltransferase regulatory subunit n=1 Tax=unclassified Meiothermus TaxID=370471 RepID=UPI000D7C8C3F|nr:MULTISPECIES: ATP phosphoribosyltransferase regulatory subunit [unclassified Meiothermus]PZA08165.1 ATP phosphoribosyltransferase regulatory subunit [Meiothermus sp. Pnk-1]RYM27491.1 ATP phosphoribosyltransferase regulatory subunit [Meiothermus sp. PNK-Is4]